MSTTVTTSAHQSDPEDAHADNVLFAELMTVNTALSRYVLRCLDDDDASRTNPLPTSDEQALADRLTTAANGIRARAARRNQLQ